MLHCTSERFFAGGFATSSQAGSDATILQQIVTQYQPLIAPMTTHRRKIRRLSSSCDIAMDESIPCRPTSADRCVL